jgi:hypothetical protein
MGDVRELAWIDIAVLPFGVLWFRGALLDIYMLGCRFGRWQPGIIGER